MRLREIIFKSVSEAIASSVKGPVREALKDAIRELGPEIREILKENRSLEAAARSEEYLVSERRKRNEYWNQQTGYTSGSIFCADCQGSGNSYNGYCQGCGGVGINPIPTGNIREEFKAAILELGPEIKKLFEDSKKLDFSLREEQDKITEKAKREEYWSQEYGVNSNLRYCEDCHGSGKREVGHERIGTCMSCRGIGIRPIPRQDKRAQLSNEEIAAAVMQAIAAHNYWNGSNG